MAGTWGLSWGTAWAASWDQAQTEVPNVVGLNEDPDGAATTALTADGFAVSTSTAYSASVAVGVVISQSPEGGEFAASGSTVEIVVSLGPEPVTDEQPSGGWGFLHTYEAELARRRAAARKRRELEEETEQIEAPVDREIAQLLRKQEAKDEKRKDLERLAAIARANADLEAARQYSAAVAAALEKALKNESRRAYIELDNELKKAKSEEEFLKMAMLLFLE